MEKILEHINFLQVNSQKTYDYISQKKEYKILFFCSGILKRIDDTTTSSRILFNLLEQNEKLEFTIGISYRAILLDILICLNWRKKIEDAKIEKLSITEIESLSTTFCNIYLSDGLKYAIKSHSKINNTNKSIEISELYKLFKTNYVEYFEDTQNDESKLNLKFKGAKSGSQLLDELLLNNDLKDASKQIYQTYDFLSKYDHYNILYFDIINQKLQEKLIQYENVLESFVIHLYNTYYILSFFMKNDEFITKQYEIASNYLKKIIEK